MPLARTGGALTARQADHLPIGQCSEFFIYVAPDDTLGADHHGGFHGAIILLPAVNLFGCRSLSICMSFLRRILASFRRPRARYGDDVLFAGWVQLPKAIREIIRRR